MTRVWAAILAVLLGTVVLVTAPVPAAASGNEDTFGFVDPETGLWFLQDDHVFLRTFYFGDPGDSPFMGDWNCDGIDTPGLYRRSDGYVYLRNSNTQGIADISFFFGDPGDMPIAGDFNADGMQDLAAANANGHTVSIQLGTGSGFLLK